MTHKLWQTNESLNTLVENYTSGDDIFWDQHLVAFDIYGSLAHAQMLLQQKLIDSQDFKQIGKGLHLLLKKYTEGALQLQPDDEDVHTRIENDLTKMFPLAGAKLHTGRSRNDQVLTDIRLFTKDSIVKTAGELLLTVNAFTKQANAHEFTPLPGMTHMQPAMLSSVGLWLGAFAESLLDDLKVLKLAFELNDQSPLGSGAAYGVSLPISREKTAALLGFSKVQNNALYCQNSRGKFESTTLQALMSIMSTLNTFATDCLLFTTEPFAFFTFDPQLGTGSSIMPQKQNWDALELMRAKYHELTSAQLQLSTTKASLPSGYNRDFQLFKPVLIKSFQTTISSLQIASLFVTSLQVDEKHIAEHIPQSLFAAHWAYVVMQEKNIPFRKAYKYVKNHLDEIPYFDVKEVLHASDSQGGPGNLGLTLLEKNIQNASKQWMGKKEIMSAVFAELIKKKGLL
jgi:argininosuccinate lyase